MIVMDAGVIVPVLMPVNIQTTEHIRCFSCSFCTIFIWAKIQGIISQNENERSLE